MAMTDIDRIKHEVDLLELVREGGVELRKVGAEWMGLCPFHSEKTPSLSINPDKGVWRCFGCNQGGSCLDWVMKRDGLTFPQAKAALLDRLPGGETSSSSLSRTKVIRRVPEVLQPTEEDHERLSWVVEQYGKALKAAPNPGHDYLAERGVLSDEAIDLFKIGYCDRTLGEHLPPKSRTRSDDPRRLLMRIGILRESGHEHFRGSVVFPNIDEQGRVTEIYSRKTCEHLRPGTPKHLYLDKDKRLSPDRGVWNWQGIAGQEDVLLTEGHIDALTFWVHGFRNVTCAFGADVFPDANVAALKRYGVRRVLVAYDRDEGGDRGARMMATKLAAAGIGAFRVLLPHRMDVNEYAQKMKPADKSLALVLQAAKWMGDGPEPARSTVLLSDAYILPRSEKAAEEKAPEPEPAPASLLAAEPAPPLPPAPSPPPAASPVADVKATVKGDQMDIERGDRCYRIRGVGKNKSHDLMKVIVQVNRGDAFHVDSLDLYSYRYRQMFVKVAARAVGVSEEVITKDLGRVLQKLEALRDKAIEKAIAPKEKKIEIPAGRKVAAMKRLKEPGLMDWIVTSLDVCGMVGERTNKQIVYLACVSRLLRWPLAILVQSESSAGKSALVNKVLSLMPEEAYVQCSAMTGQSLFYMRDIDLRHKILSIAEEEGASRASYALKLLQSEGKLSIISTGKNPQTGEHEAKMYDTEGPVALLIPTTAIDMNEELENRCLKVVVDVGREQTRLIHEMQRRMMTLEGIMSRTEQDGVVQLHQDVQRLLRPIEVRIPFAMRLTFPDHATRTRRDHMKYLCLILAVTLLHQYQRGVKRLPSGTEYIDATPEDVVIANELSNESLGRSLEDVPPQTQVFLDRLDVLVTAGCHERAMARSDLRLTRREIREALHLSDTQVRLHLDRLVRLEYVLVHRGARGQTFVYELLYAGEARKRERFMLGLIDVKALQAAGSTSTSSNLAGFDGHLAGGSRGVRGPNAGGSRTPSNGGNGKRGNGSSGSSRRSAEKADLLLRDDTSYPDRRTGNPQPERP